MLRPAAGFVPAYPPPNKLTATLHTAVIEAFEKLGGVDYLVRIGTEEPKAFVELSQNPTRRRLETLLRDAADPGGGQNYVLSALRSAARCTVYAARKLPGNWLIALKTDPDWIAQVAAKAHSSLVEAVPGKGAIRDHDLEHYCDRIAEVWKALATADITYATATETSRKPKSDERYGRGLAFMRLATALVDSSVTDNQARAQIDRIRKWRRLHHSS